MAGYVPHTDADRQAMLEALGMKSMDDLFRPIPDSIKLKNGLSLPEGLSEMEVYDRLTKLAEKNTIYGSCFRGAGAYRHYIPSVVKDITSRKEFVTAYTPYQAEISQGVLQAIFEFQTMICELTGMDAANASVYDGATAVSEAIAMCTDRKKYKVVLSKALNPQTISVVKTWCYASDVEVIMVDEKDYHTDLDALKDTLSNDVAAVVMQSPNFYGVIEDMEGACAIAHEAKAKFVASVNPISLGILRSPASYGADIAVGDGQPLGNPMAFGGPYLGFMATTKKMMRKLPGRIVGQSVDHHGRRGFVLTLQAREQHIRREKASSNICSNQALNALIAGVYLSTVGSEGLKDVANRCLDNAHYLKAEIEGIDGVQCVNGEFFHEFVSVAEGKSKAIIDALAEENILGGYPLDDNRILWCTTEVNQKADIDKVVKLMKEVVNNG